MVWDTAGNSKSHSAHMWVRRLGKSGAGGTRPKGSLTGWAHVEGKHAPLTGQLKGRRDRSGKEGWQAGPEGGSFSYEWNSPGVLLAGWVELWR